MEQTIGHSLNIERNFLPPMPDYKQLAGAYARRLGIALIVIVVLVTVILQLIGKFDIMSELPGIWVWIGASMLGVAGGLISRKAVERKSPTVEVSEAKTYNPNFYHLSIHYAQKLESPDAMKFVRPKFVTNHRSRHAYGFPDWLLPHVLEISSRFHNDERELRAYLTKQNEISEDIPLLEDLGLRYDDRLNTLILVEKSELLSQLKGRKLENLQIARLERKRYYASPARRVLLINLRSKQAYLAPTYYYELIEKGIIGSEIYGMKFNEDCAKFCKRKFGATFNSQHYPESLLIEESNRPLTNKTPTDSGTF